jgi:hypothetical protein
MGPGSAEFRAQILCGAHDGWEQQFKEINILESPGCAACSVSRGALRESEWKSNSICGEVNTVGVLGFRRWRHLGLVQCFDHYLKS